MVTIADLDNTSNYAAFNSDQDKMIMCQSKLHRLGIQILQKFISTFLAVAGRNELIKAIFNHLADFIFFTPVDFSVDYLFFQILNPSIFFAPAPVPKE